MDFYTIEINLFLVGKNVLIVMVPILINKDVSEPSYNDLKFMVQNCINTKKKSFFCLLRGSIHKLFFLF